MKDLQQFWAKQTIKSNKAYLCRLGSLKLWVARAAKEWGYAVERSESTDLCDLNEVPLDVVPDKLEWMRIAFGEAPKEFRFQPTVPDRPIVIRPSFPVMIPVGETAVFYAPIPAFLELITGPKSKEVTLGTLPTHIMSDTWFGDYAGGVFGYAVEFSAEREVESLDLYAHHIIVPIQLSNRSKEALIFEKLCLRPSYLSIYSSPNQLWSSGVTISHDGTSAVSSVRYSHDQPDVKNLSLVASPKDTVERGALQRLTFAGSSFASDFKFNTI